MRAVSNQSRLLLACVGLSLGAVGCGPPRAVVEGRVTVNGRPIGQGTVIFYPEQGDVVSAPLGRDGRYRAERVPTGRARVSVNVYQAPRGFGIGLKVPPSNGGPVGPTPESANPLECQVPLQYQDPESSRLSCDVVAPATACDLDLRADGNRPGGARTPRR